MNLNINLESLKNMVDEAKNQIVPRTEMEKRMHEALSNKNWGASSTLMNQIASDTYDYEKYHQVLKAIWSALDLPGRSWRSIFKALTLLDHLVKNGAERVVEEVRDHLHKIRTLADFNYFEGSLDRGSGVREKAKMLMELVGENGRVREEREKARRLREKFVGIGVTGGVRGIGGGLEAGRAGGFGRDSDLYRMGGREGRYTDRVDGEGGREGGREGGWERDRYYDEYKPRNGGRDGGRKEADPTVSPEEDHGGGRRGVLSEEAGEGRRRGSKEGGRLEIRLTEQKKPVSPTVDLLGGDFFGGGGGGGGGGNFFEDFNPRAKASSGAPPPQHQGQDDFFFPPSGSPQNGGYKAVAPPTPPTTTPSFPASFSTSFPAPAPASTPFVAPTSAPPLDPFQPSPPSSQTPAPLQPPPSFQPSPASSTLPHAPAPPPRPQEPALADFGDFVPPSHPPAPPPTLPPKPSVPDWGALVDLGQLKLEETKQQQQQQQQQQQPFSHGYEHATFNDLDSFAKAQQGVGPGPIVGMLGIGGGLGMPSLPSSLPPSHPTPAPTQPRPAPSASGNPFGMFDAPSVHAPAMPQHHQQQPPPPTPQPHAAPAVSAFGSPSPFPGF